MKAAFALFATLAAAPLAATPAATLLPGVSDEETTIGYGRIADFEQGHGDVLFVLDPAGQWYRLGLNAGCLKGTSPLRHVNFRNAAASNRIDKFTTVDLPDENRSCGIRSIRRSAPPPQVDSKSPVTLD